MLQSNLERILEVESRDSRLLESETTKEYGVLDSENKSGSD